MEIIKRDGRQVPFDEDKILDAIYAAFDSVYDNLTSEQLTLCGEIADSVINYINDSEQDTFTVEQIQDLIVEQLNKLKDKAVAHSFVNYRNERQHIRDYKSYLKNKYDQLSDLINDRDETSRTENSNKDTRINSTMRDYIAGFTCRELAENFYYTPEMVEAHKKGIIHLHDTDYSPVMRMTNCELINLEDMLQNGTVIGKAKIDKPHTFSTACNIACQIVTAVTSNTYGGCSMNLAHLAPFVEETRKEYINKLQLDMQDPIDKHYLEKLVKMDISRGIQTLQYQFITMSTSNGQSPFITIFMYLNDAKNETEQNDLADIIEEIFRQRIQGIKNEQGVYVTVAFPKLIYVLDENNINKDSKYFYLTRLAAECSAKRLVPDYISAKKMKEIKGDVYSCMGCRSFLAPDPINHKYWGKFNQGVVSLNLAYVALEAKEEDKNFFDVLDKYLNLCFDALMIRHKRLLGTKSDVAPIMWQHGAIARLKPGEVIDDLLFNNNSTISLGYAGLWEATLVTTGDNFVNSKDSMEFAMNVMQTLTDYCEDWKEQTGIWFSPYGTPEENTTYKFANALKEFDIVDGVNDKDYLTNSYHINPAFNINAFKKISTEAPLSLLSSGGQISYVEVPDMKNNIDAMISIIRHIYNTIIYAEINTMTSYCRKCGGTDVYMNDDLNFVCPDCGNTKSYSNFNEGDDGFDIALRVCGYISTSPFNKGRAADVKARVKHIDTDEEAIDYGKYSED